MTNLPIRQIAYFVPDVRKAALAHHELHGSGPYFVAHDIKLRRSEHRGVQRPLSHSSAYGQWGALMIEFVQQNNPEPSVFHDMFPAGAGQQGMHHVALFVDNLASEIGKWNRAGFETGLYAEMDDGFAFAMIDAVQIYGHCIELYEPVEQLTGFYDMVADAAKAKDMGEIVRDISFD